MIERVIIAPDCVLRVMDHMIAYWTSDVPKSDTVWLARKSIVFFFQSLFGSRFMYQSLSKQAECHMLARLPVQPQPPLPLATHPNRVDPSLRPYISRAVPHTALIARTTAGLKRALRTATDTDSVENHVADAIHTPMMK